MEDFKKGLNDQQKEYLKDDAAITLVLDLMLKDAKVSAKKEAPAEQEAPAEKEAAAEAAPEETKKPRRRSAKKAEENPEA